MKTPGRNQPHNLHPEAEFAHEIVSMRRQDTLRNVGQCLPAHPESSFRRCKGPPAHPGIGEAPLQRAPGHVGVRLATVAVPV